MSYDTEACIGFGVYITESEFGSIGCDVDESPIKGLLVATGGDYRGSHIDRILVLESTYFTGDAVGIPQPVFRQFRQDFETTKSQFVELVASLEGMPKPGEDGYEVPEWLLWTITC